MGQQRARDQRQGRAAGEQLDDLLAEELEPSDDGERRYVGFYTDSRALTRRVVRQLVEMGIIGQPELFKEEQLEFGGDLAPPAS